MQGPQGRVRRLDVSDRRPVVARGFGPDAPSRQLVGTATGCVSWFVGIHRLLHVGCPAGAAFQVRTISFTVLLARIVRPRPRGLVWSEPNLDACLGHRSGTDSMGAGRISSDVLLLSRGILQGFLGRSAFLLRG